MGEGKIGNFSFSHHKPSCETGEYQYVTFSKGVRHAEGAENSGFSRIFLDFWQIFAECSDWLPVWVNERNLLLWARQP